MLSHPSVVAVANNAERSAVVPEQTSRRNLRRSCFVHVRFRISSSPHSFSNRFLIVLCKCTTAAVASFSTKHNILPFWSLVAAEQTWTDSFCRCCLSVWVSVLNSRLCDLLSWTVWSCSHLYVYNIMLCLLSF